MTITPRRAGLRSVLVRTFTVFTICAAAPHEALAQPPTLSFAELAQHLKVGDPVTLTDSGGGKIEGTLTLLTDRSLTIDDRRGHRGEYLANELQRVAIRDSRRNGALIGLAVGALPGAFLGTFFATYCENEATSCDRAPLVVGAATGAVGAWIGADIDGAIVRTWRLSPTGQARIGVAPVVGAQRQGVLLSLRF